MEEEIGGKESLRSRDIRRYFCDYCGICRSKKYIITSHILTHHKEKINVEGVDKDGKADGVKTNICEECGANFKKPACLKQHMLNHSLERPFVCSVDDCHASYRRKDHLTRHLIKHQGKLFSCLIENCNCKFTFDGNMKRHVKEFHNDSTSTDVEDEEEYVCPESGCGKTFKYPSKLQKHVDSHVKLDSVEAFCSEPGCMKYFSNKHCLEAHIRSCHKYITCEICGTRQLRKNIKRHLRSHEERGSSERVKCMFKGCLHTFATKSNLQQHVKAVHHEMRPFACGIPGCRMRFSYKHVRDNHEKSGCHTYVLGDFIEADEQFSSRPRGGRKRKFPTVEMLMRKRVSAPVSTESCNVDGVLVS